MDEITVLLGRVTDCMDESREPEIPLFSCVLFGGGRQRW